MTLTTKLRIYSTCVQPVLLYGSESWTLLQSEWDKLESFHIRCQRRILHINWYDFVSNAEVLGRTELARVATIIKRRLGLFGHIARLPSSTPANQILKTCCQAKDGNRPCADWKRPRGRPHTTWIHQICQDTGVTASEALELAEDRRFWRTIATAGGYG